jgi:putative phosphonate catabolism associated alcohol dehydrogenase
MELLASTTALLFQGPGQPWLSESVPIPQPRNGDILVRVLACTICGSDLHSISGRRTVPTPSVLGHEIVGEIVEFGPTVRRLSIDGTPLHVGTRVCWSLVANCDHCFYCEHDLPQKCSTMIKYGHHAYSCPIDLTGGFAGHCLLVSGTKIMQLPASMPLEVACPISCATATIASAMEIAKIIPGETVVVFGAGMLGVTACAMAKELGADKVVCVERSAVRRESSLLFGADIAIEDSQLSEVVRDLTNGRGADCLLECSGSNQAFESAMNVMRLGGRVVLVGAVFPQEPVPIVLERIVRRNLLVAGVHNYAPRNLKQAVDFLSASGGKYPFASLVSAWYPFTEIERAVEHASSRTAVRVGLKPTLI